MRTSKLALRRLGLPVILAVLVFTLLLLWAQSPQSASAGRLAHETLTTGPYTFTVGWIDEPPYVGQMNGLELHILSRETGKGVEGAEAGLNFEVLYGGQAARLPLRPLEGGEPGAYTADILPTQRGLYTFHFTGKVGDQPIDLTVDKTDEVQPLDAVQVPAVEAGADPAAQLDALRADVASARTLALAGVAAGVLGLLAGGAAILARRSR